MKMQGPPAPVKVNVDVTVSDLEIPRLTQLQHQFIMSSNNNPDETHVVLDNAAVVATKHDTTSRARKIATLGFARPTAEWRAVAMSGTTYSDFTVPATADHDADVAAMALEMAKQRLTKEDLVNALHGVRDPGQIDNYSINHVVSGRAIAHARVDTMRDAPGADR